MADTGSPTVTVGDTYPPLRGSATAGTTLMPLDQADQIELVAQAGPTVAFRGTATAISPPADPDPTTAFPGFNWQYTLDPGDLDQAACGTLTVWLKVTWDAGVTPPQIEWVKATDKIRVRTPPSE